MERFLKKTQLKQIQIIKITIFFVLDNNLGLLNFPPKAGVKLFDLERFEEKDGLLKIEFSSSKLLKFPQKNFLHSTKKNPI